MEQRFFQILQNCKKRSEIKQTHLQIIINGLQQSNLLLLRLIDLCSALNSLDYACLIFDHVQFPNVFIWNAMIKSFNQNNRKQEAFRAYDMMNSSSILPNNYTFTFILNACESSEVIEQGKQIHTQIIKTRFGLNIFVQNNLLGMYSKCCDLRSARHVFDEMSERDVVSWNSMTNGYISQGSMDLAIQLFNQMPERNIVSWNTMVAGFSKLGDMESARLIFDRMPQRNAVSWNSMIAGYIRQGNIGVAKEFFNRMPEKTVVSWTAMLSGYTQIGDLTSAQNLFVQMPTKSVVSWNAMIAGYVQNGLFDEALHMFRRMLTVKDFKPNEATLASILSACAHLGALNHGNWVNSYIEKHKFELTLTLGNAIIDMYAKCGDIKKAKELFNRLPHKCIISWTTMILALANNGHSGEALYLFDRMCREGTKPDGVIFIAVLSACTHSGLVEEGLRIFDRMVREFQLQPQLKHYGCMVDLLSRAGKLEGAIEFIKKMPIEPNAVIWATLLGACKVHGNGELVKFVTKRIIDLDPQNAGYRVLISNSNALMGRWEDVLEVRAAMREKEIEKMPGCSSIQIGNGVHEFLVQDTRHEQRKKIYEALDGLTLQLKAEGYVPCR